MTTKIKGIYKSFKFISQIFVVKEREMEIGCPTDVKHVAHIGWDGPSGTSGPTWMKEYRAAPNFTTSLGNLGERKYPNPTATTSSSSQDFDKPRRSKSASNNVSSSDHPHNSKKNKRRKTKPNSSPRSSSSSSTTHSRPAKPKVTFSEREEATPMANSS